MSTTTARDLVRSAMQELGILAISETPSAEDASIVFDKLNLMIDLWSGKNLLHSARVEESFSLVANTVSYSIGSNQTLDTAKPLDIVGARIKDSANLDYNLAVIGRKFYNAESDKTSQGKPTKVFYDKEETQQANQSGTLYFHPSPDYAYTLYLTMTKPFTEFSSLDSNITFPVGYKKALVENLAVNIASAFGSSISQELAYNAADSFKTIENINSRNMSGEISVTLPGQARCSNIQEGY